jgi:hypothetical protein
VVRPTATANETVVKALGGEDGFGIFLSDNPALKRVGEKSKATGKIRPSKKEDLEDYGERFYHKLVSEGKVPEEELAPEEADALIQVVSGGRSPNSSSGSSKPGSPAKRRPPPYARPKSTLVVIYHWICDTFFAGRGKNGKGGKAMAMILVFFALLTLRRFITLFSGGPSSSVAPPTVAGLPSGLEASTVGATA